MTDNEFKFYCDVREVISQFACNEDHYRAIGEFWIHIVFSPDDYCDSWSDIQNALTEVAKKWGAEYNFNCGRCYLYLPVR